MIKQAIPVGAPREQARESRSWILGFTSFFFILLQSACAAVMALSSLRLLIGVGSLAAAASDLKFLIAIHSNAIRVPMVFLAVGGSAVNLFVIWRIRSLRSRPSSQWRVGPVTPEKKRAEAIQIALAILTLVLVTVEWMLHIHLHGSI